MKKTPLLFFRLYHKKIKLMLQMTSGFGFDHFLIKKKSKKEVAAEDEDI